MIFFVVGLQDVTREQKLQQRLKKVFSGLSFSLFTMFVFGFIFPDIGFSNEFLFNAYLIFVSMAISWRTLWHYGIRAYRAYGFNYRNYVVVGKNYLSEELVNYFQFDKGLGYQFLGYFDETEKGVLGKPMDVIDFVHKRNDVDIIFVSTPEIDEQYVQEIIDYAENNLISVKLINQFTALGYNELAIQNYGQVPTIKISSLPLEQTSSRIIKRAFDILFTLLIMVLLLSWLIPIVAMLIKLESKGPAFFLQLRNGRNNRPFKIYKFRTMRIHDDNKVLQATKNDSRITTIGKFLRISSIDELPQFINVLKGEMSVVGPRPHAVQHNDEFNKKIDRFMQRHSVKPGITGLAQVKGFRGETSTFYDINGRVKLDRFYVKNWSLAFDIKIILMTVIALVTGDDKAY